MTTTGVILYNSFACANGSNDDNTNELARARARIPCKWIFHGELFALLQTCHVRYVQCLVERYCCIAVANMNMPSSSNEYCLWIHREKINCRDAKWSILYDPNWFSGTAHFMFCKRKILQAHIHISSLGQLSFLYIKKVYLSQMIFINS